MAKCNGRRRIQGSNSVRRNHNKKWVKKSFLKMIICSVLMTEAYGTVPVMARYYGRVKNGIVVRYGAQIPFNFQLMSVSRTSKASEYKNNIDAWTKAMPLGIGIRENWVVRHISFKSMSKLKQFNLR